MEKINNTIEELEKSPGNIRFQRLCDICDYYFGEARQKGTGHRVYKMPWAGDPRVNIQNNKGKGKAYQVRQLIKALKKMEKEHDIR